MLVSGYLDILFLHCYKLTKPIFQTNKKRFALLQTVFYFLLPIEYTLNVYPPRRLQPSRYLEVGCGEDFLPGAAGGI